MRRKSVKNVQKFLISFKPALTIGSVRGSTQFSVRRKMEICEESGFFHEDFAKFRSDISDSEFRAFSQLENDEQRVRFVHQIVEDRYGGKLWSPVREIGIGKSLAKALEAKERGNSAFQYEKWQESLRCYNDACLLLPAENGECYEWM